MTPTERYREEIEQGTLFPDAAQAAVVAELERIYQALVQAPAPKPSAGLLAGLRRRLASPPVREPVPGLYLWGGVGRGKTHLMNGFFEALPIERKRRMHFHRFMQHIHGELRQLREQQSPLLRVAESLAGDARVLCFDEFHVSDIADAMLLGGLFEALFRHGVTLVATSNVAPDELYRDGLQRARFLPAIGLLKKHTRVMAIGGSEDYRLRALERAEIYHSPLDEAAERSLMASYRSLGPENPVEGEPLEVLGRSIPCVRRADGIAWFRFDQICDGPRGAADYIEIARYFHTVFLSEVPVIATRENDRAQRLISLVDEFYDRNVNLIVSAAAPPSGLYPGGRKAFEFQRTVSRLEEMGSRTYLARKHLP